MIFLGCLQKKDPRTIMAWGNSVMLWFLNLENTARKIKATFSKESISEFMALSQCSITSICFPCTTCNSILFSLWRSGRSAILSLNFLVRITMIFLASNYRNAIMDMVFYIRENYGVCSVNGHGYEKYPTVIDVRWLPKEERGCPLLGLCSSGFPCVSIYELNH